MGSILNFKQRTTVWALSVCFLLMLAQVEAGAFHFLLLALTFIAMVIVGVLGISVQAMGSLSQERAFGAMMLATALFSSILFVYLYGTSFGWSGVVTSSFCGFAVLFCFGLGLDKATLAKMVPPSAKKEGPVLTVVK